MAEAYGHRLLVSILEDEAVKNPDRVFAVIPSKPDSARDYREVSFKQMKCAVDQIVYLLQDKYKTFTFLETIGYIGLQDLRYNILFYAALKCRLKVFLPSPRNTFAFNASLLSQTKCAKMVYGSEVRPIVLKIQEAVGVLDCLELPSLDDLLVSEPDLVPYSLNFEEAKNEPALILHSSGSTGTPKPVQMTHGTFAVVDNERNFTKIPGRRNHDMTAWIFPKPGSLLYVPLPAFHVGGFYNKVLVPLFTQTAPIFDPPRHPSSGALAAEILRNQTVSGCLLPPLIIEQLYQEPDGPELLKRLDVVAFAGGPLSEEIGNELVKHVDLCQFFGSTEAGLAKQLLPHKEDWQYIEFHPHSKQELQPAEDGAFELVFYADKDTEGTSWLNHNFPGLREYRTKDLFRPHPSKPSLWKFHARRDDIIVLSNGEKLNPIPMETALSAHPAIAGALVVGQGHPRVALLLELTQDHALGADPVTELWAIIDKSNDKVSAYGRVSKSMVLIAQRNKPFTRVGKGSIVRSLTIEAYSSELKHLFDGLNQRTKTNPRILKASIFRFEDVHRFVQSIIHEVLGIQDVRDDENLYLQGLDSVKSLEVTEELKASLESHCAPQDLKWIAPDFLYSNLNIESISMTLLEFLNTGLSPKKDNRVVRIQEVLNHYQGSLPSGSIQGSKVSPSDELVVVLVGSTGFLGQSVLLSLAQDPKVSRIYCLNRSTAAEERWKRFLMKMSENVDDEKIVFLLSSLTTPSFGLSEEVYAEVKNRCNVILHSAWQVNFTVPLSAFDDSLQGIINSVRLATAAKNRARLLFISSIAATGVFAGLRSSKRTAAEGLIEKLDLAMETGYGESKLIAEHLIATSCTKHGISASILRVGQIAPSTDVTRAAWADSDAVTLLLTASKAMRMVPNDLMDVDWVSVDAVADVIDNIMLHDCCKPGSDNLTFYNVVNPTRTPWFRLMPAIKKWCGDNTATGSLGDWIEAVRRWSLDHDSKQLPAYPLLPFFALLARRGEMNEYQQSNLLSVGNGAHVIQPIDEKLLEGWLARLSPGNP